MSKHANIVYTVSGEKRKCDQLIEADNFAGHMVSMILCTLTIVQIARFSV